MASPLTLDILIKLALERADLLTIDPVTHDTAPVASVEINAVAHQVNNECSVLWDVLIAEHEDYCVKRKTIEARAGVEEYSLPSDFYKFRKLFPMDSAGKRGQALKKFDLARLGSSATIGAAQYKVTGNRIWLHPTPSNAAEFELWYVPQFDGFTNLTDVIDFRFPIGWEVYVIEGVAARLLEKEDLDSTPQLRRQQTALQRILVMAADRDTGAPFQMQDTEGYFDSNSSEDWCG